MATVTSYKLNGQENLPPIEWQNLEVEATFDNDNAQGNINFSTLNFVDESNEIIKNWFFNNVGATEGIPLEIGISTGSNTYIPFDGYLAWNTYKVKASNRSEMALVKTDALNGVHDRAQGITMRLLEEKGALPTSIGVNIPYLVRNRKTNLEKLQLIAVAYVTLKTAVDEIFKIIANLADLTSAGAAQAVINIALSVINLIILINKLVDQLQDIQEAIFPKIRYHRGIKLIDFLEAGATYMGYTLDTGSFRNKIDKVTLCPHKKDDEGDPIGFLGASTSTYNPNGSGILQPTDFGYVLSEAFELCNKLFYTKIAVNNGIIILKPYNDPSWTLNPSYTMPNVRIEEDDFTSNGIKSYNVDELVSRTLINFIDDTSDYWTITNVNESISETIVTPVTVNNTRNVTVKGLDDVVIPYALCVREGEPSDLFIRFKNLVDFTNDLMQSIKDKFIEFGALFNVTLDDPNAYAFTLESREGALKVENSFFSTPKIVWLEDGRIPADFVSKIGAIALYNDYHSYKSFVPGVKNPSNLNDTNQKEVFTDVRIPFGATSFDQIINNSFFNDVNGNLGKFTSVKWNVDGDYAIVSYYIFKNYIDNLIETTI